MSSLPPSDSADELVSQFMSFTGSADPAVAASYLEMSGHDLQTAVSLYLEHETGGGGGSGGGGAGPGLGPDDAVRAPDETRTMRLMDDAVGAPGMMGMLGMMDPSMQLMSAYMEEQLAAPSTFAGAFADPGTSAGGGRRRTGGSVNPRAAIDAAAAAQDDDDDDDNDDADSYVMEDDDDDDEVQILSAPEPPRLSDMFAPPTHLMHRTGGFQGARATAKDARRWLLVNLQSDAEFASHALNRDVWRDELIENLIREGFIFWQAMAETNEGRTFVERYQVQAFPHISIIDPRTGRLLWRKEGWTMVNPVTVESLSELIMDFCSRNSFDRPPQAPPRPAAAAARSAVPPQKRPMDAMDEDEQLEAALRASIEDAMGGGDASGAAASATGDDHKPAAATEAAVEPRAPSLLDDLLALTVPEEPGAGARMQFRMPDGRKVVRKFAGADPVRTIYAFFAQSNDEARGGRAFSVMSGFPPNELINDLDKTIDECKLAGETITIRWQA